GRDRHRRRRGRVPARGPARAGLHAGARLAGHGAVCGRQVRRSPGAVAGGAADGPAAPHRQRLLEACAIPTAEVGLMSERAYALRFISGKYQGGEYPLGQSGDLVIGRSSELDLVLIEDMVSRKHACITLASGGITIADLGSTNGTFVNGEKVRRAEVKVSHRIPVGTGILQLGARNAGGAPVDPTSGPLDLAAAAAAA